MEDRASRTSRRAGKGRLAGMMAVFAAAAGIALHGPAPALACVTAGGPTFEDLFAPGDAIPEYRAEDISGIVEYEVVKVWSRTDEFAGGSVVVPVRAWGGATPRSDIQFRGGQYIGDPSITSDCGPLRDGPGVGSSEVTYQYSAETFAPHSLVTKGLTPDQVAVLDERFGPPVFLQLPDLPEVFPYEAAPVPRLVPAEDRTDEATPAPGSSPSIPDASWLWLALAAIAYLSAVFLVAFAIGPGRSFATRPE